ncbi:glycoside hydrolase family 27 protein [Mariniflexile sp. AS56]|uniref:glycoside hydrolase family 27 protein n=1 Tax=Mariniflexile sp. AS56 TaxID=3063957 RepID=UPI0026E973EA|nr:glycoside hydrolase family 27 protein [Mariniflexile sp. AS56]MDO7173162.1 glycoside hydrolase family 27 protein [Mariniflexile sp. AS56]
MICISATMVAQKKAEIAKTPPMGWNSWNWFGKDAINEKVVKQVIDDMVKEGLRDAGYIYVIIDGGWRDTKLGPNGELLPHPVKFPNGIKPLADYAHSKGMKLGLHVVPGTHDCGGDPVGAAGREEVHLKQFEAWELDFIKLDQCKYVDDPCATCPKSKSGWSEETSKELYQKWSKLFNESGRDIFYSISAYKYRDWYPDFCNMARTTGDIRSRIHTGGADFSKPLDFGKPHFSVMEIVEENNKSAEFAGNGYWNDPDMLVTGVHGMSHNEQEAQFALWCMMSSPLMLGNDPGKMSKFEKNLVLNKEMIAINQDPTEQGRIIKRVGETQVWLKKLKDGKRAVLFLNLDETGQQEIKISLKELGFSGKVFARNVISHSDLGSFSDEIGMKVNTHQSKMLVLSN